MQIPCGDRILDLTKDVNNQMVKSDFRVKGEFLHFAKQSQPEFVLKGCQIATY